MNTNPALTRNSIMGQVKGKTGKEMCHLAFSFQQYVSTALDGMNLGDVADHLCLLLEAGQYTFWSILFYKKYSEIRNVLGVASNCWAMQFLTPITVLGEIRRCFCQKCPVPIASQARRWFGVWTSQRQATSSPWMVVGLNCWTERASCAHARWAWLEATRCQMSQLHWHY